jgi:hypothetical protein
MLTPTNGVTIMFFIIINLTPLKKMLSTEMLS